MNDDLKHTKRPDLKPNDPDNLVLIDGSGYIFRAFYGLPSMTNENGVPVNRNLRNLIKEITQNAGVEYLLTNNTIP